MCSRVQREKNLRYDPVADTWTMSTIPMPDNRRRHCVVNINDTHYYLAGGREDASGTRFVTERATMSGSLQPFLIKSMSLFMENGCPLPFIVAGGSIVRQI